MKEVVLFVDDEVNLLQGLRRSLRSMRKEWDMHFAEGAKAALDLMDTVPVDVVVTDMRMPEMDGAQFLEAVSQKHPSTVRFVLSGQADRETTYRSIGPSHQFFSKPVDADILVATIKRLLTLRAELTPGAVEMVSEMRCVPTGEANRTAFRQTLDDKGAIDPVGHAIARDIGLSLKSLQLTNSTYFGIGATVYAAEQAAKMLDTNVLCELATQQRFSSPLDNAAQEADYVAVGEEAAKAGTACAALAAAQGWPAAVQELARTSAQFSFITPLLRRTQAGAKIGEADDCAAYLLALWGMPGALVDVFDPLSAQGDAPVIRDLIYQVTGRLPHSRAA